MKKYFNDYIDLIERLYNPDYANSLKDNVGKISKKLIDHFDYTKQKNAVLLGHVQSGKTGTIIGLITSGADRGFRYFIVLTTDNILLYQQTLKRFQDFLPDFNIYGEKDDHLFLKNKLSKPTIVLLKKNQSILRTWLNTFSHVSSCKEEPLILIDDEADAASLNTMVNKKMVSTINGAIRDIIKISPASLYVQTTASPFANLLLTSDSTTKPDILTNFEPPDYYLGGDFFYGEESNSYRLISEDEVKVVLDENSQTRPRGLVESLFYFISHVIYQKKKGQTQDNFLIHPSHKISDHKKVADKIDYLLEDLKKQIESKNTLLFDLIQPLDSSYQMTFDDLFDAITSISIIQVNTENQLPDLSSGYHILIGGNCLGRGLTIPQLNVCYYTRTSKAPQADTLLQHSRIFGYDRDKLHAKVFLTPSMLMIFRGITKTINMLHQTVSSDTLNDFKYFLPEKVSPTRKNVVDKSAYITLSGGVNYFIESSEPECTDEIDDFLEIIKDESDQNINWLVEILNKFDSKDPLLDQFMYVTKLLMNSELLNVKVYVRRNRDISRGTGTMLSVDDRLLSKKHQKSTIVFLYRLNGKTTNGWSGKPIWLINLRFPDNCVFMGTED